MRAPLPAAIVSPLSDLHELRRALISHWPALLRELLGEPTRRTARQWRWNRRGSLSAVVGGPKAGTWFDHEAGTGGGPLELIARERGGDWRDAADWARCWLGLPAWERPHRRTEQNATDSTALVATNEPGDAEAWDAQLRHYAQRAATITWERATPADPSHA